MKKQFTKYIGSLQTIAALLVLLLFPFSQASAQSNGLMSGYDIGYSLGVADSYWSSNPASSKPIYSKCSPRDVRIGYYSSKSGHRLGRARQNFGSSKYQYENGFCTIELNKHTIAKASNVVRCATIVHEYGHLINQKHSNNSRNVMYDGFNVNNVAIPACSGF